MNAINLLLLFPFIFLLPEKTEDDIDGTVTHVYDGNTLEIATSENENFRVVLAGIDCPELTQEYGPEAKAALEKWALHQTVVLRIYGKDRLKNYIGIVFLPDQTDARLMLLTHGLAWTTEKAPDAGLESVRAEAAAERKGLWKQDKPTPPWIYRRQQSMREAKSR